MKTKQNAGVSKSARFHVLDSWRGIAALLVALYHINVPSHFVTSPLIAQGGALISLFFVLSGFVITCNYEHRLGSFSDVRDFLVLRIGRLYPLHLFVILLFVTYYWLTLGHPLGVEGNGVFSLLMTLFLLNGLGLQPGYGWNPPSWSISTEFIVYIVFALLLMRWFKFRVTVLALAAVLSVLVLYLLPLTDRRGLVFDCLEGFCLGAVTWQVFKRARSSRWVAKSQNALAAWTFFEGLSLLVMAYVLYWPTRPFFLSYFFSAAFYCPLILVFSFERGLFSRILLSRTFIFVGTLSYSIYLLHDLLIRVTYGPFVGLMKHFGTSWGKGWLQEDGNMVVGDIYYVVLAITLILLSSLSYHFVEQPWRRRFRDVVSSRRRHRNLAKAVPVQS